MEKRLKTRPPKRNFWRYWFFPALCALLICAAALLLFLYNRWSYTSSSNLNPRSDSAASGAALIASDDAKKTDAAPDPDDVRNDNRATPPTPEKKPKALPADRAFAEPAPSAFAAESPSLPVEDLPKEALSPDRLFELQAQLPDDEEAERHYDALREQIQKARQLNDQKLGIKPAFFAEAADQKLDSETQTENIATDAPPAS